MRTLRLLAALAAIACGGAAQNTLSLAWQTNSAIGTISAAGTNCNTLAACVWIVTPATATSVTAQVTGTFVATLQFETSADGATWTAATGTSTTTAAGTFAYPIPGQFFRVRASSYTSGTISVSLYPGTGTSAVSASTSDYPSVKATYGAKGDGSTDDTNAIMSCLTTGTYGGSYWIGSTNNCYFPAGTYIWNNTASNSTWHSDSNGLIQIAGFSGHIQMAPGACIQPTQPNNEFLTLEDSGTDSLVLDNFCYKYASAATTRNGITFQVQGYTRPLLRNFQAYYGPGTSVWIANTTGATLLNTYISGSGLANPSYGADGLHLESDVNTTVLGLYAENTGDDAFATTNTFSLSYLGSQYQSAYGLTATGINVYHAGGNCVRIEAIQHATVTGITCDWSYGSGIAVDTGTVANGSYSTSQQGTRDVTISDFDLMYVGLWQPSTKSNSSGHGLDLYGAGTQDLHILNGRISYARGNGINVSTDVGLTTIESVQLLQGYATGVSANGTHVILRNVHTFADAGGGFSVSRNGATTGIIRCYQCLSQDDNRDPVVGSQLQAVSFAGGVANDIQFLGFEWRDSGGTLDPDTLSLSGGTGYSNGKNAVTISGLTCTALPIVWTQTNGQGVPANLQVSYRGKGCTGTPSFSVGGGGSGATISGGLLTSAEYGAATPVIAGGGTGYPASSTVLVPVGAPATGTCYGPVQNVAPVIKATTNSSGVVTGVSWWLPPTQCTSATTWSTITGNVGTYTTAATFTVALSSAPSLPTNRTLYESTGSALSGSEIQFDAQTVNSAPYISVADTNLLVVGKNMYGMPLTQVGTALASAATIYPVTSIVHVTGTTPITSVAVPLSTCSAAHYSCQVTLIPDGLWTTATGGNIAIASTAVVSRPLVMTYDASQSLWYPSY